MAELSLSLPVKGEEAPGADAKVNAAFTEIQTQFNGKVAAINLEAEAVTGAKVNKEIPKIAGTYTAQVARVENTNFEPSATRPALVMLELIFSTTEFQSVELNVGGVKIGAFESLKPSEVAAPIQTVSFIVPAAAKWKFVKIAGPAAEAHSSYLIL